MDSEFMMCALIRDYSNLVPVKALAEKYSLDAVFIKRFLRSELGDKAYIETAHRIGANIVADNMLKDPQYRRDYIAKMKISVKNAITSKLKNKTFRDAWHLKAVLASKKGNCRIRELMHDEEFLMRWKNKCRKAGKKCYTSCSGIHSPTNRWKRTLWSLKGLKNTCKKLEGPAGEHMYNSLEARVAQILFSLNIIYFYEKVFRTDNKNGFISVDFFIEGKTPTIIEVTYWDKVEEKAQQLAKKFDFLIESIPNVRLLLLTKSSMVHKYKAILPNNISILDLHGLEKRIAGKRGNDI